MNENSDQLGTGFLISPEFCVTCHHNICCADQIFIGRNPDEKIPVEWIPEYSKMEKDVAILRLSNAPPFSPLVCGGDTYSKLPVWVRGFPIDDNVDSGLSSGFVVKGELGDGREEFRWKDELVTGKNQWNQKPSIILEVFPIIPIDNVQIPKGFSGAPILHEHDNLVVGMLEAKNDQAGYIIPIQDILKYVPEDNEQSVQDEKKQSVSSAVMVDIQNIISKGNEMYENRNFDDAIKEYDKILGDPNLGIAWNNKGICHDNLGNYEKAIECYDKALQIDPSKANTWTNKGVALDNLGNHEKAIECYDKALQIDPSNAIAWNNMGSAYGKLTNHKKSLECYDKALEIDPNYADAWYNKGITYGKLNEHKKAIECFNRSTEINPSYSYK